MDLFKKYKNVILLVVAMCCTTFSFASNTNYAIPESDCGVDASVVKIYDGEICEQDISFRMLYKFFPTTIETFVFPIINSEYLPLVPELEQQNLHLYQTQEIIFFEIFKSSQKVGMFIAGFFILWHFIALGLIRAANDGSFLGKSWNTSFTLIKYGVLIVLLLPLNGTGLLVIHVILLSVIILGIYFANYFWGVYLNYLQVGEDAIDISTIEDSVSDQKVDKSDEYDKNIDLYDHNYFFAYSYAKELSLIALCKERTEKLLFLNVLPSLTQNNVNDLNSCFVNNPTEATWDESRTNAPTTTGFIHYSNSVSTFDYLTQGKSSSNELYQTNSIVFKNDDPGGVQCQSSGNRAFDKQNYDCGSINVSLPTIPDGNVKKAINLSNFGEQYLRASIAVMTTANPASTVENAWTSLSNNIDVLFDDNNELHAFKHNQSLIKKNVSFFFHRLLMNDAIVGNSGFSLDKTNIDRFEFISGRNKKSNFNLLLSEYMVDASNIARQIETIGCLKNSTYYNSSQEAMKLIKNYENGTDDKVEAYSTSCLDQYSHTPIGIDPKLYLNADETGVLLDTEISNLKEQAITSGKSTLAALTEKIKNKRSAVERSFYLSIINSPANELANRLRKEGWAISGGYMLKIIAMKEMDNNLRRSLQNSSVAKAVQMNEKSIPKELDIAKIGKTESVNLFTDWFDTSEDVLSILNDKSMTPSRKDLKYVDASILMNDKILGSMAQVDLDDTGTEDLLDLFLSFRLIDNIKSVVGVSAHGELSIEQITVCITPKSDSQLRCPMDLTNPIVQVSHLGHSLINMASMILSVALAAAAAEAAYVMGLKLMNKDLNVGSASSEVAQDNAALDSDIAKGVDDTPQVKNNKNSVIKTLVKGSVAVLYFILKIMLMLSVLMLSIGMTLAYIIPLIPFIAFTISFLSWIVISLEILIIAPIWLSFLFRIEDSNKPTNELYLAGFNFVMQMLFRPALIVASLTIGWSLFTLIFMVVNFSMAAFMSNFEDGGMFVSLVYGSLLMLAYAIVLFIIVKQLFMLMISMPNKIFTKIGVQPLDNSFEKNASDTMGNFAIAGVSASKLAADGLKGASESSLKNRQEYVNSQKEKVDEMKQNMYKDNDKKKDDLLGQKEKVPKSKGNEQKDNQGQ